jgi:hypothetical protein
VIGSFACHLDINPPVVLTPSGFDATVVMSARVQQTDRRCHQRLTDFKRELENEFEVFKREQIKLISMCFRHEKETYEIMSVSTIEKVNDKKRHLRDRYAAAINDQIELVSLACELEQMKRETAESSRASPTADESMSGAFAPGTMTYHPMPSPKAPTPGKTMDGLPAAAAYPTMPPPQMMPATYGYPTAASMGAYPGAHLMYYANPAMAAMPPGLASAQMHMSGPPPGSVPGGQASAGSAKGISPSQSHSMMFQAPPMSQPMAQQMAAAAAYQQQYATAVHAAQQMAMHTSGAVPRVASHPLLPGMTPAPLSSAPMGGAPSVSHSDHGTRGTTPEVPTTTAESAKKS